VIEDDVIEASQAPNATRQWSRLRLASIPSLPDSRCASRNAGNVIGTGIPRDNRR
jgi:hypothetical protein